MAQKKSVAPIVLSLTSEDMLCIPENCLSRNSLLSIIKLLTADLKVAKQKNAELARTTCSNCSNIAKNLEVAASSASKNVIDVNDLKGNTLISCKFCSRRHKRGKEFCPAYGTICIKCHKPNHHESVCKSKSSKRIKQSSESCPDLNGDSRKLLRKTTSGENHQISVEPQQKLAASKRQSPQPSNKPNAIHTKSQEAIGKLSQTPMTKREREKRELYLSDTRIIENPAGKRSCFECSVETNMKCAGCSWVFCSVQCHQRCSCHTIDCPFCPFCTNDDAMCKVCKTYEWNRFHDEQNLKSKENEMKADS